VKKWYLETCDTRLPTNFSGDKEHPPCCSHLLRDMLLEVTQFFKQNDIEYFAHFGTLLGLVREKRVLLWTLDLDLAMPLESLQFFFFFFIFLNIFFSQLFSPFFFAAWEEMRNSESIKAAMHELGFDYFPNGRMARLCFTSHWHNGILNKWPSTLAPNDRYMYWYPYMDIFPFKDHDDPEKVILMGGYCKTLKREWIYPLQEMKAMNTTFFIPHEEEAVTMRVFGEDWEKPKRRRHGEKNSDEQCKINYKLAEDFVERKALASQN
jgi:hypothetical protein